MGAESVEYHRATVLGRGDDYPGMAMEYYASRGETPLVWSGSGRAGLGLEGAVSPKDYEAIFGFGGARDPRSGERQHGGAPCSCRLALLRAGAARNDADYELVGHAGASASEMRKSPNISVGLGENSSN